MSYYSESEKRRLQELEDFEAPCRDEVARSFAHDARRAASRGDLETAQKNATWSRERCNDRKWRYGQRF